MHTSTAKIRYMSKWVIADCDIGILDYYRWWIHKKTSIWVMKPKDGAHISVVRGDCEEGNWERNVNGETITFNYSGDLEMHHNYIWLPVWGQDLNIIRQNIGMSYEPKMPFHMSVGNVKEELISVLHRAFKKDHGKG